MQPLLALAFVLSALQGPSSATNERVVIEHPDPAGLTIELHDRGFDVLPPLETEAGRGAVHLIVSPGEKRLLVEDGLTVRTIEVGRPFREIQRERAEASAGTVPAGYPDLAAVLSSMSATAAAFPSIASMVDLTVTYGVPPTEEGRHLFALKISDNVAADEDEPSFLMAFCHHAREIVTPVIGLHHIEQLTTLYGMDPAVTAAVDGYEIWVAPVWNPDGYEYVFCCDNNWRKNRRDNGDGTFGVDLNRNYPFGWGPASTCSGSSATFSETYYGTSAASESETQTMVAFGTERRFTKVHDYHSFSLEVRYGYGCYAYPFLPYLQAAASALSLAGGYGGNAASSCCTAGDIHWHGANFGSHAFLWETASTFQPSYASAQAEAALVWPAALEMIDKPIPLWGHVTDACTGLPIEAALEFPGVNFSNGEAFGSGGPFGRYHAFLPAGTYSARFSRSGYATQTHPVTITAGSLQLEVALVATAANAVSYCTPGTSASGCAAALSAAGTASATSGSGFVVTASSVEGSVNGQYYYGTNGRQANPWGNGSSYRCVVPPSRRAGVSSSGGTSGACDGSFAQDLNSLWVANPSKNPGAGSTVQLQYWYRDPHSTSNQTTSFSDALEFGVCP